MTELEQLRKAADDRVNELIAERDEAREAVRALARAVHAWVAALGVDPASDLQATVPARIAELLHAEAAAKAVPGRVLVDHYQEWAWTLAQPASRELRYAVLGLTGEAGEVANKVKKVFRDDAGGVTDARRDDLVSELGDVLWYVAELATLLEVKLSAIFQANYNKLSSRAARGTISGSGDVR